MKNPMIKHPAKMFLLYFGVACACILPPPPVKSAGIGPAIVVDGDSYTRLVRYRTVLFNTYAQRYYDAMVAYAVLGKQSMLPANEDGALMYASLQLALGLDMAATQSLNSLVNQTKNLNTQARAYFYLGKAFYDQQRYAEAYQSLNAINVSITSELDAQRRFMQLDMLAKNGQLDDAVKILAKIPTDNIWYDYATFNLGVAYMNKQNTKAGVSYIRKVSDYEGELPERLSLRDKAATTLGYVYLREKQDNDAVNIFEKESLESPFSTKALLGVGWAYTEKKEYIKALAAWNVLTHRDPNNAVVQESLIAAPYAYNQLEDKAQSLALYQLAIERFGTLARDLSVEITELNQGGYFNQVLSESALDDEYLGWYLEHNVVLGNRFEEMFSDKAFQENFLRLIDLYKLRRHLVQMKRDLAIYEELAAQQTIYSKSQSAGPAENGVNASSLVQELAVLKKQMTITQDQSRFLVLMNEEEKQFAFKIRELSIAVRKLPQDKNAQAIAQRIHVLQGLLIWRIAENFPQRVNELNRKIAESEQLLSTKINSEQPSYKPSQSASSQDFVTSIQGLSGRASENLEELDLVIQELEKNVQQKALAVLTLHHDRLLTYLAQAKFAIAQLYDSAQGAPAQ